MTQTNKTRKLTVKADTPFLTCPVLPGYCPAKMWFPLITILTTQCFSCTMEWVKDGVPAPNCVFPWGFGGWFSSHFLHVNFFLLFLKQKDSDTNKRSLINLFLHWIYSPKDSKSSSPSWSSTILKHPIFSLWNGPPQMKNWSWWRWWASSLEPFMMASDSDAVSWCVVGVISKNSDLDYLQFKWRHLL